jgi:ribokinase
MAKRRSFVLHRVRTGSKQATNPHKNKKMRGQMGKSKNKITVIGSTNIDKVVSVPRFARSGETLQTQEHIVDLLGGKGFNQAVASAKSGAETRIITKVGSEFDVERNMNIENLSTADVLFSDTAKTGQAYITVSKETGDNIIYIYQGANGELSPAAVQEQTDAICSSDFLIAQLEIPIESVIEAFKIAHQKGVTTILNPAPMPEKGGLPADLLEYTDILTPNEHETFLCTGIEITDEESMVSNAEFYFSKGIGAVVITLGEKGAFFMRENGEKGIVPSFKVDAVDTTAAGDTFVGAMSTRLSPDLSNLEQAMHFAAAASAISVTRVGAQPSIPCEKEVLDFIAARQ